MLGGQKGDCGPNLLWGRGACERQWFDELAPGIWIEATRLRLFAIEGDESVGLDRPGLMPTTRTSARTLTLPSDWVNATKAALPVAPQI